MWLECIGLGCYCGAWWLEWFACSGMARALWRECCGWCVLRIVVKRCSGRDVLTGIMPLECCGCKTVLNIVAEELWLECWLERRAWSFVAGVFC